MSKLSRNCFCPRGWIALTVLLFGLVSVAPIGAVEIGSEPPGFALLNLAGENVTLADYRGQTIILKLATTWCPGCQQQIKEFAEIGPYLIENDIVLIEVFVADEPELTVREYLQRRKFKVPTVALIDDGTVAQAYRLYGIPWVLLIDRDFKVTRERGLITAADLQRQLTKMLD
ncbi:MAG: TlpA family protein disulfide reductase [Desulfuromonadales bacterium]|nr:TlpA family protein disulfide reductase [Desulfuromonadales bacterium]